MYINSICIYLRDMMVITGGSGVVPVKVAYWEKVSAALGPSRKNTSMMPLSENQCVFTTGEPDSSSAIFFSLELVPCLKKRESF